MQYNLIVLEPEAKVLDMAVVSAGRFEQSVAEVTVSMEILKPTLVGKYWLPHH